MVSPRPTVSVIVNTLDRQGIMTYPTPHRAILALAAMVDFQLRQHTQP